MANIEARRARFIFFPHHLALDHNGARRAEHITGLGDKDGVDAAATSCSAGSMSSASWPASPHADDRRAARGIGRRELIEGAGLSWKDQPDRTRTAARRHTPRVSARPPGATTGAVEVEGSHLSYEQAGRGSDVVLVHGSMLDRRMWDDQFVSLAAHFRLLRYDLRGYGRSPCGNAEFAHRDDLAELLERLGVEHAFVVALSMGAAVAVDFALTHPERVRALVLVSSGLSGYRMPDEYISGRQPFHDAARERQLGRAMDLFLDFEPMRTAASLPALRARLEEMIGEHTWPLHQEGVPRPRPLSPPAAGRLNEINVPTLVVTGALDMLAIRQQGELIHAGIRGSESVVIAGAGHMVNMERPEEFDRAVLDFLGRVEGGAV